MRNQSMSVELIEGHARVTTPQGSQTLQPGQAVIMLLGGSNGLQPASAPSTPITVENNPAIRPMMSVTDKIADPDAPTTIIPDTPATVTPDVPATTTINGCITATKGNFVVVNGYSINVGSDHTLKVAKVGDCVQITGVLKTNNGNGVEFVLVKAAATGKSNAAS